MINILSFVTAPPYYAESADGKKSIREEGDGDYTRGELDWAPLYPCYDYQNSPIPSAPTVMGSADTMQVPTIGFQPPTPELEAASLPQDSNAEKS